MSETTATEDRAIGEHVTLLGAVRGGKYPHGGSLLVKGSEEGLLIDPSLSLVGRVVCGLSNKLSADEQAKLTGDAWERLPEPRPRLTLEVIGPDGIREYALGPHTPRLRPQDVELMHQLWLNITSDPKFAGAHHYHIVALALEELKRELSTEQRAQLLAKLQEEMGQREGGGGSASSN